MNVAKLKAKIINECDKNKQIILTDYQEQALEKFNKIHDNEQHHRFYFGLKMGLGKTYTSLEWFKRKNVNHFFIVVKNENLVKQWAKNYYDIFKSDNFEMLLDTKSELKILNDINKVYIMTYARFRSVVELIKSSNSRIVKKDDGKFHIIEIDNINIIFDESQALKNHNSKISKGLLSINSKINYLSFLSGSAISNKLDGLYTQYVLLRNTPTFSYWNYINKYFNVFSNRYSNWNVGGLKEHMTQEFLNNFHYYTYIKDPKSVLKISDINYERLSLFDNEVDIEHQFKINKTALKQKALFEKDLNFIALFDTPLNTAFKIRQMLSGFVYGEKINDELKEALANFDNNQKDDALIKVDNKQTEIKETKTETEEYYLKYLDDTPTLFYKNHPKFDLLRDKLKDGENYLIFYNYNAEKEIIKKIVSEFDDYVAYEVNGKVNELDKILNDKSKTNRVIIAQSQAMAQGIDGLQENYYNIIHYSIPYSYEVYSQANARLYRQGQENNVNVYYLISHSLEDLLLKKIELYKDYNNLLFFKDIESFYDKYKDDNDIIFNFKKNHI